MAASTIRRHGDGERHHHRGQRVAAPAAGIENSGTLTVINSTIADNSTGANGGGGIVNGGTLTAVNSTIAYNDGGFNFFGGSSIGGGVYDVSW